MLETRLSFVKPALAIQSKKLQVDFLVESTRSEATRQMWIDDLYRRLDASKEGWRKVQAQLTALLTNQRPEPMRRRWWQ